jgi:hypothetical protein
MPEIEVSADEVSRLGESLGEISAFLTTLERVARIEPWAFGPGTASDAVQDVLGNWERNRLLLGRHLDSLAAAARAAGGAYVRVEADVAASLGGP